MYGLEQIKEMNGGGLDRLKKLVADPIVQNFPETSGKGLLLLLEMRNLITALAPRLRLDRSER